MLENRRRERVARAPAQEGGAGEESAPIRISAKEWLEQMKARGSADAPPDAPKGNKDKRAMTEFLGNFAVSAVFGEYKLQSPGNFEAGLRKFATSRTRMGGKLALLAARLELDARDRPAFLEAARKLDAKLREIGVASAEAPEENIASVSPDDFIHNGNHKNEESGRVTEEELLKALSAQSSLGADVDEKAHDQVSPIGPDAAREIANAVSKAGDAASKAPKHQAAKVFGTDAERAVAEAIEGIPAAVERALAQVTPPEPAKKKEPRARMKKEGPVQRETARQRDARIKALAEEFDRIGGADESKATEVYQRMKEELPEADRKAFRDAVHVIGWDVNGDDGHEASDTPAEEEYIELRPLGSDLAVLKERLGRFTDRVDGIPYWVLPDGHAAVLGPRGEPAFRVGPGGVARVKDRWYRYESGGFKPVPPEENTRLMERDEAWRAKEARQLERALKPEPRTEPQAQEQPQRPRKENEQRKERAEDRDEERSERARSLDEAKKIFFRAHNKEKKEAGKAFREAAAGLSEKNRRRLIDFLADTTDVHREVLGTIHRDFERENKDRNEKGERTGNSRLEREIDEDIERIGSGRSAPERPRERSGRKESEAERVAREIEEDIAAILAK